MSKKLLIFVILLTVSMPIMVGLSSHAFAQSVDTAWVRRYNGPVDSLDYPFGIAVDGSGNVFVTGRSQGSGTYHDYATIKYHPNGDTAWLRRYNGPDNSPDLAFDIAVDDLGNAYVTGRSYSSVTNYDYATIKYYPNGDTAWVRTYDGPMGSSDLAYALVVDDLGNVYVTGYSIGSGTHYDYATIKYYPNGDTAWVRRYNGPADDVDYAHALAVDGSGNVYVTGYSFGNGTDRDYTTIKYSPNGDTAWLRRYNGPGDTVDVAEGITVDGSGNVYVTGASYGNSTAYDYATIKYYPNGDTAWIRRYNGPGDSLDVARAIVLDDFGNIYVTGLSYGSGTSVDCATIKYYPDGDTAWIRRYNGDADSVDGAYAITVDGSGNAYVTGYSWSNEAERDYVTIKYYPDGDLAWVTTYNGPADSADVALDIVVDDGGCVYVTGYSFGSGTYLDYTTIKYVQLPEKICKAFVTPKRLNVAGDADQTFRIHLHSCEPMSVSKGDSAEVYVDVDASLTFDDDERYPAIVSSPAMVVKVYCPDLVDNDPKVIIFSINNIPISDNLGNDIVLYLDTFTPPGKSPKSLTTVLPDHFSLSQNSPNPFNPTCEIEYALPTDCQVTVVIYNILGQKVRILVDVYQDAGYKSVEWNGKNDQGREVTSGVYFYNIKADDFEQTKKMVLMR